MVNPTHCCLLHMSDQDGQRFEGGCLSGCVALRVSVSWTAVSGLCNKHASDFCSIVTTKELIREANKKSNCSTKFRSNRKTKKQKKSHYFFFFFSFQFLCNHEIRSSTLIWKCASIYWEVTRTTSVILQLWGLDLSVGAQMAGWKANPWRKKEW